MKKLIVVSVVLFAALCQVSVAAAQVLSAPAPSASNLQGLPWWFVKHQYMPGMPWFHRNPPPPAPRQCRIWYWYQAQFWNTDQWGNTVTWVDYAPQYICD
jgi:hypothetical protein